MIKEVTSKTKLNIIEKIVDIHRQCVIQSNASWYKPEVISEWLSDISIENVLNQLQKPSKWIILEEKSIVTGFAQYSFESKEIFQIQIHPNMQRLGYGKKLYEYIEKDFRVNNLKTISLYSTLNSIGFYSSLGFAKIKKICYPNKNTKTELIEMRKTLR